MEVIVCLQIGCGICMAGVKTGQGTAVFKAECGHAFHFPCIAAHVRNHGRVSCPVCSSTWLHAPLLTLPTGEVVDVPDKKEKAYSDDEPLDPGEDGGEFRGFFVAHPVERIVEAELLPEAAVISAGGREQRYVVALRIKAPPAPPPSLGGGRAPVDLVAVLDVGGGTTDAKMGMLKRSVRLVVASLGPADRLSLVVAAPGAAHRPLPLRRMTSTARLAACRHVDGLFPCAVATDVSAALGQAGKVLEDRRERNPVATIMLISDDLQGQTPPPHPHHHQHHQQQQRSPAGTRFAHVEIPVDSFGFGSDALAKCIGGLLSVVVQDLQLHLSFPSGEIAGVYSTTGRPALVSGSGWVRLGDLYAEEERELLLELRLPAAVASAHHALSVKFAHRSPPGQSKEQALLVPRPHAGRSSDRLRAAFVATRAATEARRLADDGDLGAAFHVLSAARAALVRAGAATEENLCMLEVELAELHRRRYPNRRVYQNPAAAEVVDEDGGPLTPTSGGLAAEQLAKVRKMRRAVNRVSDLHGFENARF